MFDIIKCWLSCSGDVSTSLFYYRGLYSSLQKLKELFLFQACAEAESILSSGTFVPNTDGAGPGTGTGVEEERCSGAAARGGPDSTLLFGGVSSSLLQLCPLPSFSSHPSSLSLPPGREKPVFGSQRGRERESPLVRVTKRFPQRESGVARARESSAGSRAVRDLGTRPGPLGWVRRRESKKRKEEERSVR